MSERDTEDAGLHRLCQDAEALIARAHARTETAINSEMIMLNWQLGLRIRENLLGDDRTRADAIVDELKRLAAALSAHHEYGYRWQDLMTMVKFVEAYPNPDLLSPLAGYLSWELIMELLTVGESEPREFYLWESVKRGWTAEELREQVEGRLHEHTASLGDRPTG